MAGSLVRSRWAGFGAAVAVSLGAGGAGWIVNAASAPSSFVSIAPCRLFDTRTPGQVGDRGTALAIGETLDRLVWGTNGGCTIPNTATAIAYNLTVPDGESGFLTVFPGDAALPASSSINPVSGEGVKVNGGVVGLSATGGIKVSTANGPVNVVMDITGYFVAATTGSGPAGLTGPAGPPGAPGAVGPAGVLPEQVVWVAKAGTGTFQSVNAALASITDNSAGKPYLIRIAPGTYPEAGGIDMKTYVDIEGSGQDTTTITCACGSATSPTTNGSSATVRATGPGLFGEVRGLTIANTGPNTYSSAIWTTGVATGQLSLHRVTTTVTGGSTKYGVVNVSSSPSMTDVTATATGGTNNYGVYNVSSSSPSMTDVTATATGGSIANYGVVNVSSSSPSMTDVTATATGGGFNYGVFNSSSSPSMTDVTATATGGGDNLGVYNQSSSPMMTGGRATAGGGSGKNTALWNVGGSPVFNTVTATGTGGTQARGINNQASATVTLVNVTASGTRTSGTPTQDWGIDNYDGASMTVRDSFITGNPNSIVSSGAGTVRVANTRLNTIAGGTMTCINAYNATTFALLNASCQ